LRDGLVQLLVAKEGHVGRSAKPPSAAERAGPIEGVVEELHVDHERRGLVVRFLLRENGDGEHPGSALTPVEMRGEELLGVLVDGHRVSLAAAARGSDGTARPVEIWNLTTNAAVGMSRPRLASRLVRGLAPAEIRTALISALVGAGISIAFSRGGGETPSVAPGDGDDRSVGDWLIAGGIVLAAVALLCLIARADRRRGWVASALVGLVAGLSASFVLLAD
jgi:hypothetical protein